VSKPDEQEREKWRALCKKIYTSGDGYTDKELADAIEFFTELEWRLELIGLRFHHAWFDVYQHLLAFQGFKQSREEGKKRSI
jgi:hypothetical protein